MLEWRRVGRPLPGVPPGEEAHDGAMRILGVISVLSDSRRLGNTLPTRRKLLSGDEGEQPNHQPPSMPEPVEWKNGEKGRRPVIYSWNQVWIGGNTVWLIRTNKANKTKSLQTSQAHTWRVCNVYTGMCSLSVSRIQAAAAATAVTAADCICNPSTSNSPLKPTARLQLAHFVAICVESY